MKKWNAPEMMELAIECTYESNNGNIGYTGEDNPNYKTKTKHCECGHSTNFVFCDVCGAGDKETGDDTVVTERLS